MDTWTVLKHGTAENGAIDPRSEQVLAAKNSRVFSAVFANFIAPESSESEFNREEQQLPLENNIPHEQFYSDNYEENGFSDGRPHPGYTASGNLHTLYCSS